MKVRLACLILLLTALPALGQARLMKSAPAAHAKTRSPRHVVLTFSEALEPAFSGALVMDTDGRNFNSAPMQVDGPVMTLTPGRLPPGVYRVVWHAVGHDSRRKDGEFSFTVKP